MDQVAASSQRTRAIQHILAGIFASQRTLRVLAPEFKWAGLGNLLGDFGELVAIEAYGLTKAPAGSSGYDAVDPDGRTVQIKANFAASQVGFRGQADLLLVLAVKDDGTWTEIYYGPFAPIADASRRSERDNKSLIALSKLRQLAATYSIPHEDASRSIPAIEVLPIEPCSLE
ncbi:hypothetical protein [Caballeronia sp. GAWG1-5s-s]|uniref:DUF6998 domain-containing protein n=1 Tax=Caballeronia sp. GAWG1-5s-s TaxID=2921743 RepID=UPI002028A7CD|nr:hypothetical protein [Caballeronia sp. GAWG1-5s-s]